MSITAMSITVMPLTVMPLTVMPLTVMPLTGSCLLASFLSPDLLVAGTQMHWITALFLFLEAILLVNQWIYSLAQPEDKTQKHFLILLGLIIVYNFTGGLFPDPQFDLPILYQNMIAYASGFGMCMYAPYYFYKAFALERMRFHARYGVFVFLLAPFLIFFVAVYWLTGDLDLVRRWGVFIPFFYAVSIIYSMTRSLLEQDKGRRKTEILLMYLAVIPWISLTVITYLNAPQAIEVSIVNSGMVMVTVLYLKKQIRSIRLSEQYRQIHYRDLLLSKSMYQAVNQKLEQANRKLDMTNRQLEQANTQLESANQLLEEKVQTRTRELERLNERRMNTFFNLAHEMKTPLTLLKNYMDTLAKTYPEAEPVHFAKKHTSRLSRDITNLFDLLNSEKSIHQYNHKCDTNFSQVVLDRVRLFEAGARNRHISIEHQIEENLFVPANQTALERVVNNLIDNALKYSPSRSVIHINLQVQSEDTLSFNVTDQGMGIEPAFQDMIFEPYARISHTHTRGMGMGLPIVRTILDQIGGSIRVESDPEQQPGSEFTITLPYKKDLSKFYTLFIRGHEPILAPPQPSLETVLADEYAPASYPTFDIREQNHSEQKKTILVVEDNAEMMRFLIDQLSNEYNVHYAFDGIEATEKLGQLPQVDLIVCDIMMPRMDGFAFRARMIESQPEYLSVPFLFLSARSEQKIKALQLQADFIEKPFETTELLAKIGTLTELTENTRQQTRLQMIDSIFQFQKQGTSVADKQTTWSDTVGLQDQALPSTDPSELNGFQPQSQKHQFMRKLEYLTGLTIREKQIMSYFAHQIANKQIADKCNISESTAAKHIQNIFRKLGVSTKEQAIGVVLALKIPVQSAG